MGKTNTSFTWRDKFGALPTQAEMVASQVALAEDAARKEAAARQLFQTLAPGDPRLPQLRDEVNRYASDQRHFRAAAREHQRKHLEEVGQLARRDRQPGEDDDEAAPSAWAEVGWAVGR